MPDDDERFEEQDGDPGEEDSSLQLRGEVSNSYVTMDSCLLPMAIWLTLQMVTRSGH